MKLDINFIREQYAVFRDADSAEWAFFENAGGSYIPDQVLKRFFNFLEYTKVQPYGLFPSSKEAGTAMDAGYQCIADLINADGDDLTIGPSTTLNLYVLAQAFRPSLKDGDEIIVTNQDHEANIGNWRRLSEFGIVTKEWQVDPQNGELNIDDLKLLISDRTRLVCFNLCSNIVGTLNDVKAITKLAHQFNALAIADGVAFAPHQIPDVNELDVDVYLHSTYKTFGTHLGVMWIKQSVMPKLYPQGHYFNADKPHYNMNPTGPLHAEIAALAGIGDYYDTIYEHQYGSTKLNRHDRAAKVFELFVNHERRLSNLLLYTLKNIPNVRILGQSEATSGTRSGTISFIPEGIKSSEVVKKLLENQIAVRNGHFYVVRLIEALGIKDPDEGVVRISLVHYNTEAEINRLCQGLKNIFT
ncbi:MAG: aminotransferase class V-fold PLP-dependent enzyme [Deltaproteobacteria bacterium]|jgi:cysteine desulfurase family protein (TIGR01976 family)|nr:aminotransferase class V-fold PLP-dependent enzyme [Deltaproteobacteria bacterium]